MKYKVFLNCSLFFLLTLTTFSYGFPNEDKIKTLEIGAEAPDFLLHGIDGKNYCLKDFESSKILVIIFTANHCPTAQAYEDRIMELAQSYGPKGVAFVCISSNNPEALRLDEMGYTDLGDTFEEMIIRAKDKKFNFPYLYDGDDQIVCKAYGATATPHVFIFNSDRKLYYTGRIDDSEKIANVKHSDTKNAIDDLLSNKKITVEKTKAFGCSIKWSYKKESSKQAVEKWNKEAVELTDIDLSGIEELVKKIRIN